MIRILSACASLIVVTGLVTACVSVLPEPAAPDALLRIEAQRGGAELPAIIVVKETEAPRLISGTAMVSQDMSGALRLIPGVEWAGPATRQLQLALVDSFALAGEGAAVLPESGVRATYQLNSRVQTLGLVSDIAVCELSVSLVEAATRRLVAQEQVTAQYTPQSLSASDRALALKQAAENCVSDMADFAAMTLAQ